MPTYLPLTEIAHAEVRKVLGAGDLAIDATCGNGHDTLFLAGLVGPEGTVLAMDRQAEAIARVRARLDAERTTHVQLVEGCHSRIGAVLPPDVAGRIGAVMFNLGYLPSGDHAVVTGSATTIPALAAAATLLRSGGLLSVLAYTGHPGGEEEAEAVRIWTEGLSPDEFTTERITPGDPRSHPPVLFLIRRK